MGLAADESGGVWAIPVGNRYRIYRCAPETVSELHRPAEWYPDYEEDPFAHRPLVNPTGMTHAGGLLWILVQLPKEWEEDYEPDLSDLPETLQVIDVIDPQAARVVGHAKVELADGGKLVGWVGDLAYGFVETPDGGWLINLYSAHLLPGQG